MLPWTIWDNRVDYAFDSDNMLLPRIMETHKNHEECSNISNHIYYKMKALKEKNTKRHKRKKTKKVKPKGYERIFIYFLFLIKEAQRSWKVEGLESLGLGLFNVNSSQRKSDFALYTFGTTFKRANKDKSFVIIFCIGSVSGGLF